MKKGDKINCIIDGELVEAEYLRNDIVEPDRIVVLNTEDNRYYTVDKPAEKKRAKKKKKKVVPQATDESGTTV